MRKPFYLRYIEGEDGDKGGSGKESFPKDTPLAEMTVEQREAYWKHHARKHEGVANSRADYDQQKADAEKWRQYQNDNKPADQKAIDDAANKAREEARAQEQAKLVPRLVKAEFKSIAADVGGVTKDLLEAFLEDVNPLVYLKADGELDTEKIEKRVKALAPVKQKDQPRRPNHQGYRPTDGATSVASGRDLFATRNKKG
jgi:hypothetical protein